MSIHNPAFQKQDMPNKSNLNISYAQKMLQQGAQYSNSQSNNIKYQKFKAFKKVSVRNSTSSNFNYNLQPQMKNLLTQINTSNISQCGTQFYNKNESNYFSVDTCIDNKKKKKQKSRNFSFLLFKKKISVQDHLLNKYPKLTISDETGKVTSLIDNKQAKKEEKQKNIQIAKQIMKAIFPQGEENITDNKGSKRQRKHSLNVLSNIYEIQQLKLKKITQKSLQLDKSQKMISNSHQLCQNCHKYLNYNHILKQTLDKFKHIVDNFKQLEQFYRKFAQYLIQWKLQINNKIIDIHQLDQLFIQPFNSKQILNQIKQFQIAKQQQQIINQSQKGQSKYQKQLDLHSIKKIDQKYKHCKINEHNSKFHINISSQKFMKQEYISSIDNKSEKSQFSMKSIGKIVKNYKFDKNKELLFQLDLKNEVDDKLYLNKIQQTLRTPRSPLSQKIKLDFIKINLQNRFQVQRKIGKIKKNPKYDSPQPKSSKSRVKKFSTSFCTSRTNSHKKQADNCFANILQALNNIKSTCL